jgi:hypothetical protein
VQVCGIFLFVFLCTPWLRFSSCFYFGGESCFIIFSMLFDYSTYIFYILFEHILFFFFFFSMTPLAFCKNTRREISLELWRIYFWWVDGMFCVTPDVQVSMCMWVYVISIMEAWKDSSKGHNNLAKLNGLQASICRRFKLW